MANVNPPPSNFPVVDSAGRITLPWLQFFQNQYSQLDTPGVTSDTAVIAERTFEQFPIIPFDLLGATSETAVVAERAFAQFSAPALPDPNILANQIFGA